MENTKVPITMYAEVTPNPAVMKFVANKLLLEEGMVEYKNIDEAKGSPLASKLFHFPFVKQVFITSNYVSITKFDIVSWEDVVVELREFVREFLAAGNAIVTKMTEPSEDSTDDIAAPIINKQGHTTAKEGTIEERIVAILDEYVKPAVEQDGGNIAFRAFEAGKVTVALQGACSGCPSSTMTLKSGIENILKQMLPGEIEEVVASEE
ncbi:MAG: Fe-S cluster biogenesis protein NfuA [Flavobacteriales bacterium]|jgi:Fe-S cluster biogenesis protein NfuA